MGCVTAPNCLARRSEVEVLECQASLGDKLAQLHLGERLEMGVGVAPDPARAARLYRAASSFTSGMNYIYLAGVNGKPGTVLPLRTGADKPGLTEAQYRLGLMYLDGRGVRQDRRRAKELIGKAADAGYGPAKDTLASLSEE
jgi:TPR repeat protein